MDEQRTNRHATAAAATVRRYILCLTPTNVNTCINSKPNLCAQIARRPPVPRKIPARTGNLKKPDLVGTAEGKNTFDKRINIQIRMKTKTEEEVRERVTSVYAKTLPDFSVRCPCSQNWKASKTCENTNWICVCFRYIQSNPPAGTISLPVSLEECHLNLELLVWCHTTAFHHRWSCVHIFFFFFCRPSLPK